MEKSKLDRRTFVMGAVALGAAALSGGVLGSCADGAAEPAATPEPAAPERRRPHPMRRAPRSFPTIRRSRRTSLSVAAWAPCRGASPGCATRRP